MQKKGKPEIFSEETVEKELLKKFELKNSEPAQKQKEVAYQHEMLEEGVANSHEKHFGKSSENMIPLVNRLKERKSLYSIKNKAILYNEKLGLYNYYSLEAPEKLGKISEVSKLLLESQEVLDKIAPKKEDLNFSENFNFRFFKYLDQYRDIFLSTSDLFLRNDCMNTYLFHILNHVLKSKEQIEINDEVESLLEKAENKSAESQMRQDLFVNKEQEFLTNYEKSSSSAETSWYRQFRAQVRRFPDALQDQGFTSPKVLVLVPYKKHVQLLLEQMVAILRGGSWKGVVNKNKYKEEYTEAESMNDCFRLGISFNFFENKLKLYESFAEADIIVASPLGLKLTTSSDDNSKGRKAYDFLSSIEVLLVDFAEVFLNQNTEHLEEILSFVNKPPRGNENMVKITRIRDNVKENHLQRLRQNIFVSHFKSLDLELVFKRHCGNLLGGAYFMREEYPDLVARLKEDEQNADGIKLEFKMLNDCDEDPFEAKFNYFTKNLWQSLCDTFERHTIIFVSSPLDFIRLKAFFKKNSVSVTIVGEETDKKDWQRNRLFFEIGKFKFLLYSERAHFYKKVNLRFAKNIFFYSLPEDPAVFSEMLLLVSPSNYSDCLDRYKIEEGTAHYSAVIALVNKLEKYNLEKALGTRLANYIQKSRLENYCC